MRSRRALAAWFVSVFSRSRRTTRTRRFFCSGLAPRRPIADAGSCWYAVADSTLTSSTQLVSAPRASRTRSPRVSSSSSSGTATDRSRVIAGIDEPVVVVGDRYDPGTAAPADLTTPGATEPLHGLAD